MLLEKEGSGCQNKTLSSASAELKGDIIVNGKKIEEYFFKSSPKAKYLEPLHILIPLESMFLL